MKQFKVGDVVQMKSGGALLIVESTSTSGREVAVLFESEIWGLQREIFNSEMLCFPPFYWLTYVRRRLQRQLSPLIEKAKRMDAAPVQASQGGNARHVSYPGAGSYRTTLAPDNT